MNARVPEPPGELVLRDARRQDQPCILNMMQLYYHDLMQWAPVRLHESGLFAVPSIDKYFERAGHHALLIRVGGELAGFALVDDNVLDEDARINFGHFFMAYAYRHHGLPAAALAAILRRIPGHWEIVHATANRKAIPISRQVLRQIALELRETAQMVEDVPCTVFHFRIRGD
ncbi:MAG: hypothetical protein V4864_15775 [Pseudomonadota bacterium]